MAGTGAGIIIARLAYTMGTPSEVGGTMDPTAAWARGGNKRSTLGCTGVNLRPSRALPAWGHAWYASSAGGRHSPSHIPLDIAAGPFLSPRCTRSTPGLSARFLLS